MKGGNDFINLSRIEKQTYLDNIIIYSKNELEYEEYIYKVLYSSARLASRLILRN